jgi:ligand-binding sensor domain-containing protein
LLVDAQGDLWVGLEGALLRYDGENWERIPVEKYISVLAQGLQGRLWVGDWEGFYAYDPAKE